MNNKKCSICGKVKDISDFNKSDKIHYRTYCKDCLSKKDKERWKNIPKDKKLEHYEQRKTKVYYLNTLKKIKEKRENSKITKKCGICGEEFRTNNPKKLCCGNELCKRKLYYHKDKVINYKKENKEKINKWFRDNYHRYKGKYKEKARIRTNMRRKEDNLFHLKGLCRDRINKFIKYKGFKKNSSTKEMIGCSWNFLKEYLESQFTAEMTWENYGSYWEIDHKVMLKNAKNPEDLFKLCNYKNLRPLEKSLNRSKKYNELYRESKKDG